MKGSDEFKSYIAQRRKDAKKTDEVDAVIKQAAAAMGRSVSSVIKLIDNLKGSQLRSLGI